MSPSSSSSARARRGRRRSGAQGLAGRTRERDRRVDRCGRPRMRRVLRRDRARASEAWASASPRTIARLQAASALGQATLQGAWEGALARHGVAAAQILLTAATRGSNRVCQRPPGACGALPAGALPVVNENDATATDEITFGDNDALAAQVAILVRARLLVLLTEVEGVYSRAPGSPGGAHLRGRARRRARPRSVRRLPRSGVAGWAARWLAAQDGELGSGILTVIADGAGARACSPRRSPAAPAERASPPAERGVGVQALAAARQAGRRAGSTSTPARARRSSTRRREPARGRRDRWPRAASRASVDEGGAKPRPRRAALRGRLSRPPRLPQSVDTSKFEVGGNLAATPGLGRAAHGGLRAHPVPAGAASRSTRSRCCSSRRRSTSTTSSTSRPGAAWSSTSSARDSRCS